MKDNNIKHPPTVHAKELETNADPARELASSDSDSSSGEDSKRLSRTVQDEISRFEESFKDITRRFRIVDRIGEGTSLGKVHTNFS